MPVKNPAWRENFEIGRGGANFTGSSGAGRTGSGSSWVSNLPFKSPSLGTGKTARKPLKGRPRVKKGSKPY